MYDILMGAEKVLRGVLLSGRSRVRIAPGVPNKEAILRWLFCLPRQQMRTRREIPETSKFRALSDGILLVGGILWSIPETSKIRALGDEFLLVGGIPLGNRAGCAILNAENPVNQGFCVFCFWCMVVLLIKIRLFADISSIIGAAVLF